MIKSIKGLVALVTGGASGLGLGTVQRLVRNGAKVALCDLPTANVSDINFNESLISVPADVTSEEDIKQSLSIIEQKFGRLDVVVNCAAIGVAFRIYNFNRDRPHLLEDFIKVQKVNTMGTFNVIRLAAGYMNKNEPDSDGSRGVIINTSGVSAFDGQHGQSAFAASNAAIVSMTLSIARDLASSGIRCCTIAPGHFDTPLLASIPDHTLEYIKDTVPFPSRLGNPDEFGHLVQFLIENPMMNGETIRIDGALRLHC